jgi:hypothetical protein
MIHTYEMKIAKPKINYKIADRKEREILIKKTITKEASGSVRVRSKKLKMEKCIVYFYYESSQNKL